MRLLIPSAAATLLALLVGGLLLMNGTAPVAFADVVENVKNAKSVTYVLKEKFESQAALEQEQTEQERIFYIHGNAHRVEFYSAQARGQAPPQAPLILLALIVDAKQKKALELDFVNKTARKIAVDDRNWEELAKMNVIDQLRHLTDQDAERIGEEQFSGRKTHVYRLKKIDFLGVDKGLVKEGDSAKVWVDATTRLPVRIELVDLSADRKHKATRLFEEFTWNQPLDADLFKLEVPKGFALKGE